MKKGFTLIEMLLYISILSIIVLALSSFMFMTYSSRIKSTVISEVEQQGSQTMNIIAQNIRNASGITGPIAATSATSLTLTEYIGSLSPTVIAQSGNKIQITEGTNPAIDLTSNRVIVSNLSFSNLSRPNTPGVIQVKFNLTHINPDNRGEYSYSKDFTTTASLRWP
jgi:prepilin-type N-terminal cleavage/methylation domain-containing protein